MKELTQTAKARFFAQYWGQTFINGINGHSVLSFIDINDISLGRIEAAILLKPLSSITDEDAIEVAIMLRPMSFEMHPRGWHIERTEREIEITHNQSIYEFDIDFMGSIGVDNGQSWEYMGNTEYLNAYDFLRSKGYALPFIGLSVEEMVQAGWLKLSEKGGSSE